MIQRRRWFKQMSVDEEVVINYVEAVNICIDQLLNYTELENKILNIIKHAGIQLEN